MKLEQPKIRQSGDLKERVEFLERYLYRLVAEIQIALDALEKMKGG